MSVANGAELFGNQSKTDGIAEIQLLQDASIAASRSNDFDWHNDPVLIPEQPAIAIYPNSGGSLTIRQHQWPSDDSIVTVNFDCLGSLIEGLQRYLPESG